MSKDNMTESQRNQLAVELTGPGAFERHTAATIERLSGLVVELVRERSRVTTVKPPKIEVRDMKAELSAEPVSYADEFGAAEDMAKLRRERCALRKRAERAEEALGAADAVIASVTGALAGEPQKPGYLGEHVAGLMRERDEARTNLAVQTGVSEGLEAANDKLWGDVRDRNALIGRVWSALGVDAGGPLDETVAAQRRELLDLRSRVELGTAENRRLVEAAESQGRTIAKIQAERDEARAALEKQRQAFPGAELEDLRCQVLDYRQRLGAVESALDAEAVIQDYTERVEDEAAAAAQEELTHIKEERAALVKELGKAQDRIMGHETWQGLISGALGCSPASAFDRVEAWKTALSDIQTESNEAPAQGEEL